MNSFEVIKTVRVTEKGTTQGEKFNQYTVVADKRANKVQIRLAVQELFKVNVIRVNTVNVRGKDRRQRTAQAGRDPGWKKALVTLKAGEKINLT
jgi:large subunit ribosomal protein L23